MIDKWSRDILPKENKCKIENANDQPLKRLSLGHLSGAFTILLIGYVWAIGVFIGERILGIRRHGQVDVIEEDEEIVKELLAAPSDVEPPAPEIEKPTETNSIETVVTIESTAAAEEEVKNLSNETAITDETLEDIVNEIIESVIVEREEEIKAQSKTPSAIKSVKNLLGEPAAAAKKNEETTTTKPEIVVSVVIEQQHVDEAVTAPSETPASSVEAVKKQFLEPPKPLVAAEKMDEMKREEKVAAKREIIVDVFIENEDEKKTEEANSIVEAADKTVEEKAIQVELNIDKIKDQVEDN